jgi:hypothetical protein
LKTEHIDPPLPDISQSLRLLRNLLETVYKRGASGKEVGKLLTHAREPGLS